MSAKVRIDDSSSDTVTKEEQQDYEDVNSSEKPTVKAGQEDFEVVHLDQEKKHWEEPDRLIVVKSEPLASENAPSVVQVIEQPVESIVHLMGADVQAEI